MISKKVKDIIEIVFYVLVFYSISFLICKSFLICYEKTQNIYCNYAVENGDYEDNTADRLKCAVDFLEKFSEEEND